MRHSVSISLPDPIYSQLKSQCKKEHASSSEVIREALREYFFESEFSRLHKKAVLEMAKRGIKVSEDEIFSQIS